MAELAEGGHDASVERTTVTGVDGVAVPAILARPADSPEAGIVLHPDILGIRPLFDDLCRRLATNGFVVCAPEPFARAPEGVRATEDPMVRMGYTPELDDDLQITDLERAADLLRELHGVDRVSVLGFCMGGMQVLKAAATGVFARAVAFYGMVRIPPTWAGGLRQPLDTAADVCPTLAIFGGVDALTPTAEIEELRAAWTDRPDCEIVIYPEADHGFVHAPERPAHRPDDAADAWAEALAFLRA